MRKIFYSLMVLFMGITSAAFAQQAEAAEITSWDGSNYSVRLGLGDSITFEYTADVEGTLYIYADDQSENDMVPVSISGGWYHDGAIDPDALLQEAGNYENGVGVYGWIKVYPTNKVRFTIAAAKEAEGQLTAFTLKSLFFTDNAGDNFENPIALTQGTKVTLRPFANSLEGLDEDYATWCSFTAPSDGVASILTEEYLIYYIEAESFGVTEELPKYAPQDDTTNDHEFAVKGGKEYLVYIPNRRPTEVTFKMTQDRLGLNEKFPNMVNEFPAELKLVKGNNYYKFSHEMIADSTMMEVAAAGWKGTITYMDGTNWGAFESDELTANTVSGKDTTFYKNVDTRFLDGNSLVINFNVTDQETAEATLTLRKPNEGESFEKAITATLNENSFSGPARDYWFAYTAETDSEISFASSATIKHVNKSAGVELLVSTNVYRVDEGETIYVCVTTKTAGDNTLTITSNEIVAGDYCDKPIIFNLGDYITIEGRGIDNFHQFVAEGNGFAVFNSPGWSIYFREECGGRQLAAERIVTETPIEDSEDSDIQFTYKLPVLEGNSYIVELQAVSEEVVIATTFEAAKAGDVCATAVEIENLNDTIKLDYEFGVAKWYKVIADKSGFYTVYAKLGQAANMTTKVGDCDAAETNALSDNNHKNAYMGGYKTAKVYVEEGQTLYIYTKTGSENVRDEEDLYAKEFGANFYLLATFAEPRPGESVAVAIEAEAGTEYPVLNNDATGYEQWYTYTIPAGKEQVITLSATMKFISNSLSFYKEDKVTSMSAYKGDFTQTNLTNDTNEIIGKSFLFAAADADRTIYIKVSTVNAMYNPVVWEIESENEGGDNEDDNEGGNEGGDDTSVTVEKVATKTPEIYDLMGRRVESPTKGIYIINGVKRVIK